ncbi:MAG: stage II sporulation protein R [Faecousia sp.]
MKSRWIMWILLVFFTAMCLLSVETLWTQHRLAEKTIRLHVVANSDSAEDQAQKLQVRDAVLEKVAQITETCSDAASAKREIALHIDEIREAAQKETAYDVQVRMGTEQFETRYYDTFTLPAGEYPALRVNLGKAQGHNWWCVVFPSLCTAATSDALERTAAVGGFDSEETELIEGGEEAYELRFKSFEWLQALLDWIS